MTYSKKLQDPRWQKKRLKILERDNWACQLCGDRTTTFNIHHIKYSSEPWDAPNENLISLCYHCHSLVSFLNDSTIHKVVKYTGAQPSTYFLIALIDNNTSILASPYIATFEFNSETNTWLHNEIIPKEVFAELSKLIILAEDIKISSPVETELR